MKIAIIVAFEKSLGIGNKGRIVWNFPCDRNYFKTLTTQNFVVFGRRTYEEIGRPLPNRINIVVSKTKKFRAENLYTVKSLDEAISLAQKISAGSDLKGRKIFLCGGELIYHEGIPLADEIFTTQIQSDYNCDTFFPEIDESQFEKTDESSKEENGVRLNFVTYTRKA